MAEQQSSDTDPDNNTPEPQRPRSPAVAAALVTVPVLILIAGLALLLADNAPQTGPEPQRTAQPIATSPLPGPDKLERTAQNERMVESARDADAGKQLPSVRPATPWRGLSQQTVLTRIGVGSCANQRHPQPIWDGVLRTKPQLFLMVGDNVYGDVKSPDLSQLIDAYRMLGEHPDFAVARRNLPFLAIWDDHDYGINDGDGSFPYRRQSADLFRDFWDAPFARGASDSIYYSRVFGPEGRRVRLMFLDTRSFRSRFKPKTSDFPHWGRYSPDPDPAKTMLGDAQWRWLENQLTAPADLRIIVSSIQVLSQGHGFERWGNLPTERARLLQLIERTNAKGTILLSGDRHLGALYAQTLRGNQILPELTASSLNRPYGPSRDASTPELVSSMQHVENFGFIDIDWQTRKVTLSVRGRDNDVLEELPVRFTDLGLTN